MRLGRSTQAWAERLQSEKVLPLFRVFCVFCGLASRVAREPGGGAWQPAKNVAAEVTRRIQRMEIQGVPTPHVGGYAGLEGL